MVDRLYFEEIGLLDEGMEVYGGENVELGIRVSNDITPSSRGPTFIQVMCGKLTMIMALTTHVGSKVKELRLALLFYVKQPLDLLQR